MNPLFSAISRYIPRPHRYRGRNRKGHRKPRRQRLYLEVLEDRMVLSPYIVTTTADSGTGSLRDAITQINADTSHTLYASSNNPIVGSQRHPGHRGQRNRSFGVARTGQQQVAGATRPVMQLADNWDAAFDPREMSA
jgi:hypothetical protein